MSPSFPNTVTLGHAAVYPARPIPPLHELRSVRKPRGRASKTQALHTLACSGEEFVAVCEFLAERRIGGATKGKTVSRNQAK